MGANSVPAHQKLQHSHDYELAGYTLKKFILLLYNLNLILEASSGITQTNTGTKTLWFSRLRAKKKVTIYHNGIFLKNNYPKMDLEVKF